MNLVGKSSNKKRARRAFVAALTSSFLLVLPSCGIPQLRCPQPGAVLPNIYNHGNGWNNLGAVWGNGAVSPSRGAASDYNKAPDPSDNSTVPDDQTTDSKNHKKSPFSLAGLVKPASSLDLDDADKASGAADQLHDGSTSSSATPHDGTSGPAGNNPTSTDNVIGSGNGAFGAGNSVISTDNSAQVAWNSFFDDPCLTSLIGQALSGNQELLILTEDIQIAANEVRARRGAYFPFVTLGAGAGLEKPSLFTPAGAVEDQLNVLPGKGFPEPLPDFLTAANLTWEIDIWRKLRNARDAASLRYLGTAEGRNYMVTRMIAEVAENYYELLALDNRLVILDKTIELQQASLTTAELMMQAARGTELAVQRFQAEVRKNQSEKLVIQQQIVEAENRINFLLGRYPQPVERPNVDYIDMNLHALSVGVPAQLLQNRPDIRQAERELQAAGLDVKVARARFYPSLGISAGVGYRAFNTKYLLTSPESLIYNVAGDLVAPLFNRAAIKADYLTANAMQLQAVYNYQRTILNAYTEVVNHIAKVENYRQSIEIKKDQLEALVGSVDTATKLFQSARGEYLDVLLSQRDMMEARMVLVETKQEQLAAIVNAYQALGGGSALAIPQ
ncbi:MAG: efflux transporter outer membrane subunit [Pirellulaceae bacterium]|jgi:multidrug efflux system outer membrane protein|nr:efflux transporter outer membrane subunit [Pirellulaceae bacterium]